MRTAQAYAVELDLERRSERHRSARLGATRSATMKRRANGYRFATLGDLPPGTLYQFRLDGDREYPDPASRPQPQGVHGPSKVIPDDLSWQDRAWFGVLLHELIIYELHVGTFTAAGTFDAVIPELDEPAGKGATWIELMPVAQFPGSRNRGYDGVYPFAVQQSYGGAGGLKRLVDAAHALDCLAPPGAWLYLIDSAATRWLGSAGSFAPRLYSNGVSLDIAPKSVCVLWRAEEE